MKEEEKRLKKWLAGLEKYYVDSVPEGPLYRRPDGPLPIWQMWWQGVDQSPALVRICMEATLRRAGGRPVNVVTRETLADYVEIPGHIYDRLGAGAMSVTHFSDIARVYLLAEHGGTWIDASTLLTGPIPEEVTEDPFFAFRSPANNIRSGHCLFASSFIHAWPGHAILVGLARTLANYWRAEESLADYFLFQYLCHGVVFASPVLTRLWVRECSQESLGPAVGLVRILHKKYEPELVGRVLHNSSVHFLTRKYSSVPKGSNLEEFLAGNPVFLGK